MIPLDFGIYYVNLCLDTIWFFTVKIKIRLMPGSINSKNGEEVRILQRWDGQRPYINWILKDFQRHLIQKKLRGPKQREEQAINCYFSTDWTKAKLKG